MCCFLPAFDRYIIGYNIGCINLLINLSGFIFAENSSYMVYNRFIVTFYVKVIRLSVYDIVYS